MKQPPNKDQTMVGPVEVKLSGAQNLSFSELPLRQTLTPSFFALVHFQLKDFHIVLKLLQKKSRKHNYGMYVYTVCTTYVILKYISTA